ncbi:hypothetical protein EIP91_001486, partial [Steccherinum ochraceum]
MRFFTAALALAALSATAALAVSADAGDHAIGPVSGDSSLHRRFVDVIDAIYARGVHDGLQARSYDTRDRQLSKRLGAPLRGTVAYDDKFGTNHS